MQENIDYSSPNDGLGDKLRNAFIKVQNNFTELFNGKVDKIAGKVLSENDFTDSDKSKLDGIESGAQVNVNTDFGENDPDAPGYILNRPPSMYASVGHFHFSDLATQITPLAVLPDVPKKLTNDTLGAYTELDYAPYGISLEFWDATNNQFDFSNLTLGDSMLIRVDLTATTTSANQTIKIYIKLGIGTASEYDLLIDSFNVKTITTDLHIIKDVSFSIDNDDWNNAPAEVYILSDDDAIIKVNGWYVPIVRKSVNIIDFNSDPLKLDKVTTADVEKVYIKNADGTQGMKPTSEFKDVLEFANLASFPVTGETSKIYLALDTNKTYRWTGSAYVQIGGGGSSEYMLSFAAGSKTWVLNTWYQRFSNDGFGITGNVTSYGTGATPLSVFQLNASWLQIPKGFIIDKVTFGVQGSSAATNCKPEIYITRGEVTEEHVGNVQTNVEVLCQEVVNFTIASSNPKFLKDLTVASHVAKDLSILQVSIRETKTNNANYSVLLNITFKKS